MLIEQFPKVENIYALPIPLPDPPDLITANVYALGKGPITLIDTGPKIPGALGFLQKKLRRAGFNFSDIERIIITHGHVDHFGLAAGIREAAGHSIEYFIHREDKRQVSGEHFQRNMWGKELEHFMAMVGMPEKEISIIKKRFSFFKQLADPVEEVTIMEEGDEFIGDSFHLRVIHSPGHTPGGCCLYESRQKVLFSGDHVIKHITPNPIVEIDLGHLLNPQYQSLKAYLNSLDKLAELDVHFVFTGHGEYIDDLSGIISSYKTHHQERMDVVWRALKKKFLPLYHLIDDVFPFVPENDIFLAVSEIFVHLEMLIAEGRAELVDTGPPALYRAL